MTKGVVLRDAVAADWPAIAALQTATWRFAYRGILSDRFLDHDLEADRVALWRGRFENGIAEGQVTVLAEPAESGAPLAFACILAGYDRWGSLVDNLHVHPDRLRLGLGRAVLRAAAARLVGGEFAGIPLHLTVYEKNPRAIAAYESYRGRLVERPSVTDGAGVAHPLRRYLWDSPAALLASLDEGAGPIAP